MRLRSRDSRPSLSSAVSPSEPESTGCATCDKLALAYTETRLQLRDRDREIAELRGQMHAAVAAERVKVEQAVTAGLEALQRGTIAELEAARLASVALSDTFDKWEATETDDD